MVNRRKVFPIFRSQRSSINPNPKGFAPETPVLDYGPSFIGVKGTAWAKILKPNNHIIHGLGPENITQEARGGSVPATYVLSAEGSSRKFSRRLSKPLIGNNGRIYACSEKDFVAFESNGSIAWIIHSNHTCNADMAPVYGGREKIFVAAENRILKINLLNNGTSEPALEVFLSFQPPDKEGKGEVIGISVSTLSSSIFVNIKGQGLFAYTMHGQLLWSAGPVLNQFGYRQGCRKNETDCHFISVPVIDQCEATIYIPNTEGELYSLSIHSPHFKWIQDFSMFDRVFTVTPGNNGRLYVVVPARALLLALDVLTGNVLWQGSIGPLSSEDSSPVVDSNGWVSIGSLDGFLYSFSPSGVLKKFSKARASDSVIQVSPVLDCSGYAIYISQTEMEGKISHIIGEYTYVSALKPKSVIFTLFVPATGSIYWSETNLGNSNFQFSSSLSNTDLQHFVLDERILLAFFAASKTGNKLACRSRRQKVISTCSQSRPKLLRLYTGSERAIFLFLLLETAILIVLAGLVRFCCVFWRKKKLQGQNLGSFLDKRRSLQLKKKSFDRTITDLQSTAGEEAADDEVLEKLGDLVREREGIERKLSSTYSLGRDKTSSRTRSRSRSLLPLYNGKNRSFSFQGSKKERVTIFHTLSDTSSEDSGADDETSSDLDGEELEKAKAKAAIEEAEDSSSDENGGIFERGIRRSPSEPTSSSSGIQMAVVGNENVHGSRSLSLKRRKALSSTS
ncbi:protein GAMETE EXPRESSED 3 [Morus notabilis]|uniref:protein GAMETE EXPRESSED 3 n=1 Tax=Morus notabilis TaxID=981085 RepID=UPI000CED6991|nr:protein GAMETE EXPRESSED 3 [Morus notabilis]